MANVYPQVPPARVTIRQGALNAVLKQFAFLEGVLEAWQLADEKYYKAIIIRIDGIIYELRDVIPIIGNFGEATATRIANGWPGFTTAWNAVKDAVGAKAKRKDIFPKVTAALNIMKQLHIYAQAANMHVPR